MAFFFSKSFLILASYLCPSSLVPHQGFLLSTTSLPPHNYPSSTSHPTLILPSNPEPGNLSVFVGSRERLLA